MLNDLGLLLKGVLLNHGSHEDIITILGESWGSNSLVVVSFMIVRGEVVTDGYGLNGNEAKKGSNSEIHFFY
jgi:hypothetical protein